MATLNITEISETQMNKVTQGMVAKVKGATMQNVTISGTSAASSAFASTTRMIRVFADAACAIKIASSSPTAAATDVRIPANSPEYFDVDGGDYIAGITV